MYVFLICLPCCKRTWCENRLWFKHLLNVLHPYTHTHTHSQAHTHWDTDKAVHPRKKVPGLQHLSPLCLMMLFFVCCCRQAEWKWKEHKQRKEKSKVSTKSLGTQTHSHTHTHNLAHLQDTMSFQRFCHRFLLLFLPTMFLLLLMLSLLLLSPLTRDFPSVHNDETRKTETPAPLSHNVFVDLFILVCGRVKMVYAIRESRWKGLKIDWTGFNRNEHLWWKNTSTGNLWKNLRSLERKANFLLMIGCTTILLYYITILQYYIIFFFFIFETHFLPNFLADCPTN